MSKELRSLLLSKIIAGDGTYNYKYSSCYNALRSVISLERKESKDKIPKTIFNAFEVLEKRLNELDPRVKGIPFLILEEYLMRNHNKLDKYLFISHAGVESEGDLQVSDLYLMFELFFQEMYSIAVSIADYYSLDIKMKSDKDSEIDVF